MASRKLRPYFHAHSIEVLTNYLLRHVLKKLEASGRLLKWVIELSQFKISYKPQTTIKAQALAYFIAEFTFVETAKLARIAYAIEATKVVEMVKNEATAKTS